MEQNKDKWSFQNIMSLIFVGSGVFFLGSILLASIIWDKKLDGTSVILGIIVAAFGANMSDVRKFIYGSTQSSQNKDAQIANSMTLDQVKAIQSSPNVPAPTRGQ